MKYSVDTFLRTIVRRIPLPPLQANFEPTKMCNLACDFCRRHESSSVAQIKGVGAHFTQNQFKEALSKLKHVRVINWIGDGEPLMNPDFNKLIEMSADRGIRTTFTTNGILVTKKDIEFWKKHKVVRISCSVDTPDPERYKELRLGGTLDKPAQTCKWISESGIYLQMSSVLLAENIEGIPRFVDFAKEIGARRIALSRPHLVGTLTKYSSSYPDPVVANPILKIALDKAKKAKMDWHRPWYISPYHRRCMVPFVSLYIQIGGDIQSCCFMMGGDRIEDFDGVSYKIPVSNFRMGNILTDDFGEIWHGDAYKELRNLLIKSERPVGTTVGLERIHALRRNTDSRFSSCLGCLWRWSTSC